VLVEALVRTPIRRHGRLNSVLVEPFREYPGKRETHRSLRLHRRSADAQERLDEIRRHSQAPLADWRVVLENLLAATPERPRDWHEDAVTIAVPPDAVGRLHHGVDVNMDAIGRRTGCVLRMAAGAGGDDGALLRLSGSNASLGRATEEVLRLTGGVRVVSVAGGGDGKPVVEVPGGSDPSAGHVRRNEASPASDEGVVIEQVLSDRVYQPYNLTESARTIPKPAVWTKASFDRYVAALTNGRLAPHLHAAFYRRGSNHQRTVVNLLHAAFHDPAALAALSTSAFNRALAYMARHGPRARPDAQALLVRMDQHGVAMDTATFNALLGQAVKTRDLRAFDATLRLMRRRRAAPDLDTWLAFLRLFGAEEVKRYVVHAMHARGLLRRPDAVARLARELVAHDADRAALAGRDAAWLLRDVAARYGGPAAALAPPTANKMLEVLGRYGRFADCRVVLDAMRQAAPNAHGPDAVSLNTVLTHCKLQHSLGRAIAFVRRYVDPPSSSPTIASASSPPLLPAQAGEEDDKAKGPAHRTARGPLPAPIVPDTVTYHLLFETAWRDRSLRAAAVVWRYAVLARRTSWRMRRRASVAALAGLVHAGGPAPAPTRAALRTLAASLGHADDVPPGRAGPGAVAAPAADRRHHHVRRPGSRTYLGAAAARGLGDAFAGWEPALPLGVVLQEAWARDKAEALEARRRRRGGEKEAAPSDGAGGVPDAVATQGEAPSFYIPLRRKAGRAGVEASVRNKKDHRIN